MRGILIDPFYKEVKEVEVGEEYTEITKHLNHVMGLTVHLFTLGDMWKNGDSLYVDDEGLLKPLNRVFKIDISPSPLAGCGLILGSDREDNSKDAESSLMDIQNAVTFTDWRVIEHV